LSCDASLADLGADVIKVEPTGGAFERHWSGPDAFINGESIFHLLGNRNQRSIAVNLRSDTGKEVLRRMLPKIDVLIESFRPGALQRLGLGYDDVKAINPSIIYASLSGYGSDGPYRDRPGQDVLVQALSGLTTLNGRQADPPTPVGASVVDQHAAALAAIGILGALMRRQRTGIGCKVESNLLNAALDLQIEPLSYYLNGFDHDRDATGVSSRYYKAPYGIFATQDGHICLSITAPAKLAEAFSDPWFTEVSAHAEFAQRAEINQRVAKHLGERSTAHWLTHLAEVGVWHAPVNTYADVATDPQVSYNEAIRTVVHPRAGAIRLLNHPIRYDGSAPQIRRLPPANGEHTAEVLGELGYDRATIEQMTEEGSAVVDRSV
jgi:crotonobetainyl-CoA:carnitine CoA-transferase CaiB-like acyl-CoA transferase